MAFWLISSDFHSTPMSQSLIDSILTRQSLSMMTLVREHKHFPTWWMVHIPLHSSCLWLTLLPVTNKVFGVVLLAYMDGLRAKIAKIKDKVVHNNINLSIADTCRLPLGFCTCCQRRDHCWLQTDCTKVGWALLCQVWRASCKFPGHWRERKWSIEIVDQKVNSRPCNHF